MARVFINVDFELLESLETIEKPPACEVILEISEKEALHDMEAHLAITNKWREEGYGFAIDDFGAGFISLPFLAKLTPEYIKLDRLTIRQAVTSEKFREFLNFLVQGLRNYAGQGIIAEGIEIDEELEVVRSMGVSLAQGFLLDRPNPLPSSSRRKSETSQRRRTSRSRKATEGRSGRPARAFHRVNGAGARSADGLVAKTSVPEQRDGHHHAPHRRQNRLGQELYRAGHRHTPNEKPKGGQAPDPPLAVGPPRNRQAREGHESRQSHQPNLYDGRMGEERERRSEKRRHETVNSAHGRHRPHPTTRGFGTDRYGRRRWGHLLRGNR